MTGDGQMILKKSRSTGGFIASTKIKVNCAIFNTLSHCKSFFNHNNDHCFSAMFSL